MFFLVFLYDKFQFFNIGSAYFHLLEHLIENSIDQITQSDFIACKFFEKPNFKIKNNINIEKSRIKNEILIRDNIVFKVDNFYFTYNEKTFEYNEKIFEKIFIYNDENENIDVIYEQKITNNNVYDYLTFSLCVNEQYFIHSNNIIPISSSYSIKIISELMTLIKNHPSVFAAEYRNGYFKLAFTYVPIIKKKKIIIPINCYVFNYVGDNTKKLSDAIKEFNKSLKYYN
jgi:hypothetical protein